MHIWCQERRRRCTEVDGMVTYFFLKIHDLKYWISIELKTKTRLISNRRNRMLLTLFSPVCCIHHHNFLSNGKITKSLYPADNQFSLLRVSNDQSKTSYPCRLNFILSRQILCSWELSCTKIHHIHSKVGLRPILSKTWV